MRIDQTEGRVEAGVGNAPNADFAVVVGDIFGEPLDGVVSIGAVVGVLWSFEMRLVRRHVDKCAFRKISAADVLIREDEAFLGEQFRWAKERAVVIDSVWPDRI